MLIEAEIQKFVTSVVEEGQVDPPIELILDPRPIVLY
jgi:hypothetical protein